MGRIFRHQSDEMSDLAWVEIVKITCGVDLPLPPERRCGGGTFFPAASVSGSGVFFGGGGVVGVEHGALGRLMVMALGGTEVNAWN